MLASNGFEALRQLNPQYAGGHRAQQFSLLLTCFNGDIQPNPATKSITNGLRPSIGANQKMEPSAMSILQQSSTLQ
eukprot:2701447-Amphidinium_carterae.1